LSKKVSQNLAFNINYFTIGVIGERQLNIKRVLPLNTAYGTIGGALLQNATMKDDFWWTISGGRFLVDDSDRGRQLGVTAKDDSQG